MMTRCVGIVVCVLLLCGVVSASEFKSANVPSGSGQSRYFSSAQEYPLWILSVRADSGYKHKVGTQYPDSGAWTLTVATEGECRWMCYVNQNESELFFQQTFSGELEKETPGGGGGGGGGGLNWTIEGKRTEYRIEPQVATVPIRQTVTFKAIADYSALYGSEGNPIKSTWAVRTDGDVHTFAGADYTFDYTCGAPGPRQVEGKSVLDPDDANDTAALNAIAVKKIQYKIGEGYFEDVPDPLYMCKGQAVTFKAIPDPTGLGWPDGKPTWSGTAGVTGVGETKQVVFDNLSMDPTDYKTVVAECGNSVEANVVVVELNLVKGSSQAYASPDIFPDVCRNAQSAYRKAKWKAVVKPVGVTASIFEVTPAYGGNADIDLIPVGQANLAALQDGEELWVVESGESGPYEIELSIANQPGCEIGKNGSVFAFDLELNRDESGDSTAQSPSQDEEISISKTSGAIAVANGGDLNGNTVKGGRLIQNYKLKVVCDADEGSGLRVSAEAKLSYSSSGVVTIYNTSVPPSLPVSLSARWGIVSLSLAGAPLLGTRGRSAAGSKLKGDIAEVSYESPQLDKSDKDVGWPLDVPIEKSFTLSPSVAITDKERVYVVGSTEYEAKTRVDCVSAVMPGTILGMTPTVDTSIKKNTQTLNPLTAEEVDGKFQIVQ